MKCERKRINHFDWIRGCMIIWMLVYHISINYGQIKFGVAENGPSVFSFMSFFMAPFYVISGFFFSNKSNFKSFIENKIRKLFIPYCTFTFWGIIIFETYCYLTKGVWGSLRLLEAIPTGGFRANTSLWFFISLLFCNAFYYLFTKWRGGRYTHFLVSICFILAFLTHNKPQILGYGNVLLGLSFIHIGAILKNYNEQLNKPLFVIIGLFFCLFIAVFAPQRIEFVRNYLVQGNYFLNYIYTVSACFALWGISQMWEHNNLIGRGLIYLGRNSLVVFAFHRPVLNWVIEPIVRLLNPDVSYYWFLVISLICILLLYVPLYFFLRKNFPILIATK